MNLSYSQPKPEKFLPSYYVADMLGIPRWQFRNAMKLALIKSYSLGNTRKYVLLSEVLAALEQLSTEGMR